MILNLTVVQVQARKAGNSTVTFGQFDEKGQQIPRTDGATLSFKEHTDALQFVPGNVYELTLKPKK